MKLNKKAIFWDNDGILVDTEKYYYEATKIILKKIEFDFTKEMYIDLILVQAKGPWHLLDQNKFPSEIINEMKKERDDLYLEFLLTKEILIDGVETVVALLSEKYNMAIVTSSKPLHFNAIHSRTGLLKYFHFVITAGDYTKYKPDPEPYLTALNKIGIDKEKCVVIEDSRRGLLSAKAAGLDCIIIPNDLTFQSDFSEADMVLSDIQKLTKIL